MFFKCAGRVFNTKFTTDLLFSYMVDKSSPKSFGKSVSLPLHQRMHSPTACASCSLYNAQRSVTWRYGSITGHYRTLQSIVGRYGMLRKHHGVLWSVTEHYGALFDVTEHYGSVADHYGTLRECYRALTERYGTVTKKIVPIGDWGHLLTLTLTSDDLESHIVVNVSSTSNIVPSFINIRRSRFFGKFWSHMTW